MRIWRKRATIRRKNHSNLNKSFGMNSWTARVLLVHPWVPLNLIILGQSWLKIHLTIQKVFREKWKKLRNSSILYVITLVGRTTEFAPVKSLQFSELILGILLSEFRFTVFFPLGCGVDSWNPPFQFFQTAKGKAPKEAWGGHLSRAGIGATSLRRHKHHLSAIRCLALN